jgi:transcription elongation factor Elf1
MLRIKIPWAFIKSTLIVVFISTIGALGAYSIGGNFWASFSLLFAIQYILFSFLASLIKNYQIQKTRQLELEVLEPLSTILECAYCNTQNVMTFLPDQNERVEFICTSCEKKNLVSIQFVVARITEPVNMPNNMGVPSIQTISDEKE